MILPFSAQLTIKQYDTVYTYCVYFDVAVFCSQMEICHLSLGDCWSGYFGRPLRMSFIYKDCLAEVLHGGHGDFSFQLAAKLQL